MRKKFSLSVIFLGLLMIVVIYFFPQNTKYLSLLAILISFIGVIDILIDKKKNDLTEMFINCGPLDVSNFDTSNITNMECMFDGCDNLTDLNLSDFDTNSVNTKD